MQMRIENSDVTGAPMLASPSKFLESGTRSCNAGES
jgi:hypothetical protein